MTDEIRSAILRSIVHFTRSLIYHREITIGLKANPLQSNFWIATVNNHLDIAVIEWCKLFGADDNATHWKKHCKDEDDFRQGLLKYLEFTREQWDHYWTTVVRYRNEEVAHFEPGFLPRQAPWLTDGYRAMQYAYEYFQFPRSGLPKTLTEYEANYRPIANEIITRAIASTAEIRDNW